MVAWLLWTCTLGAVVARVTDLSFGMAVLRIVGWVTAMGAIGHLLGRRGRWPGILLVALGTGFLGVAVLDLFAHYRANQGLWVLFEVYEYDGMVGISRSLKESGVGIPTLMLLLFGPFATGGLLGLGWQLPARLWPRLTVDTGQRWAIATLIAAVGWTVAFPGSLAVPRTLVAFYGPSRMAARFIAEGNPATVSLPRPPPLPPTSFDRDELPADAPKTVILMGIESLRPDFIDAETMPNVHRFAQTATAIPTAYAGANTTHPSWFSLVFSAHGMWWHHVVTGPDSGRLPTPLQAFKRAGYRIHVRSGADFNYMGIAAAAFGPNRERTDSYVDVVKCAERGAVTRPEMDRCATDAAVQLLGDPKTRGERALIIIAMDGTHFPYDWDTEEPRFTPVVEKAAFNAGAYNDLAHVHNRFRSGLFSVDRQIGRIFEALQPLQKDGVAILVTGDHGEELIEHGKMAHDSELCDVQTRVPMLFRGVGKLAPMRPGDIGSHVDVLPTLLHAVGLRNAARTAGQGVPLQVKSRRWAFLVHGSPGLPFLAAFKVGDQTLEVAIPQRTHVAEMRELFLLQTYPSAGAPIGQAVDRTDATRAAINAVFGEAIRAVFAAGP